MPGWAFTEAVGETEHPFLLQHITHIWQLFTQYFAPMCRNMKRINFWPLNTLENAKRCLNALYVRRWLQQQYDDWLLQRQTAVQESGFTALCSLLAAPPPREAVRSPLSLSVNQQQFLNPWWWIWRLPRPIHVYDFIQPWIFDKVRPINIWLMCSEHNQIDGLDWP